MSDNSLKVSINRLLKAGKLIRLARGYYALDYSRVNLEHFSVNYYAPSYLSFEWALAYYGILSQQSLALTLASVKRRKNLEIGSVSLVYRQVQAKNFWGYKKINDFIIADPEKAFLDQAYLSLNGLRLV
jgi:predicted transcriptional regulator of viral defense system